MMLRSSDNTDQTNEEYHDATGLETPSRSQLPRMLSVTLAEFDERFAEAIRAQTQNLTTSSTANRPNVTTPNRPRRGSRTEEATPPRQTSAEVSASGLAYNAALESVLELKRLKLDLVLTTSSENESIKRNQISTTTVGSNKRFKALDNMLHVVGLYPMAMGTRREPVPTRQNTSGYSEPTTSENRDGTFNYVPADDVTRWAHDKKRLYNVMLNALHESTHYLCADRIAIYRRMHKHFYGHTEADINRLRRLLQNFKGSTTACFKEDLVKFTTSMTEFEYTQARSSTEQERLQFLHNAFINDPRPNTKAYFMSCHSNMLTYHQTLERSVRYFRVCPTREACQDSYALNILSRYSNNPGARHIKFLKHLLRYVKYAKMDRLKFTTHDGPTDIATMTSLLQLKFQCDADLAVNKDNRQSQTL